MSDPGPEGPLISKGVYDRVKEYIIRVQVDVFLCFYFIESLVLLSLNKILQ